MAGLIVLRREVMTPSLTPCNAMDKAVYSERGNRFHLRCCSLLINVKFRTDSALVIFKILKAKMWNYIEEQDSRKQISDKIVYFVSVQWRNGH
jgi:hypothetical protein